MGLRAEIGEGLAHVESAWTYVNPSVRRGGRASAVFNRVLYNRDVFPDFVWHSADRHLEVLLFSTIGLSQDVLISS